MADPRWTGAALAVAQVETITVGGTVEAGDLFDVVVNTKIARTSATTTSTSTTAADIDTTLDGLDEDLYPEFTEFTSDDSGSTVVLTGTEEGRSFTVTVATYESNGGAADAQTIGTSTTTAASGPHHWDSASNWNTAAAPADADNIYIDNTDAAILYGLDQSAIEPTLLFIAQSFTGTIGLPKVNEDGGYPEYRSDYLTIGPTTCIIGRGPGSGSGRIKINFGTDQTDCTVENSGSRLESDLEAVLLKGTHVSNVLTVRGNASVGVAVFGGETAVLATLTVSEQASVRLGVGVTLTTINVYGGTLQVNSAIGGTITILGGTVAINGTATVAQLTIRGGTVNYNSTGTISGNTVLSGDSVLDFSGGTGAVTVSNPIELQGPNCRINDPFKRVASLVVDFNEGADVGQVTWGVNVRLSRTAPS